MPGQNPPMPQLLPASQAGSRVCCTHPPSAHCFSKPLEGLTFPHLTVSVRTKLAKKEILPNPTGAAVFKVQMGDQM